MPGMGTSTMVMWIITTRIIQINTLYVSMNRVK